MSSEGEARRDWRDDLPEDETDLTKEQLLRMMEEGEPAHLMGPPRSWYCEHFRVPGSTDRVKIGRPSCGACGPLSPDWSYNS